MSLPVIAIQSKLDADRGLILDLILDFVSDLMLDLCLPSDLGSAHFKSPAILSHRPFQVTSHFKSPIPKLAINVDNRIPDL